MIYAWPTIPTTHIREGKRTFSCGDIQQALPHCAQQDAVCRSYNLASLRTPA